jgi:hypothetical protein
MTLSYKPVILTFALIVLLFYFIGITELALAQLSASITINNAARTNNSSNNSECFSSSVVNIIRIPPKIVPNVLPPLANRKPELMPSLLMQVLLKLRH